jgi:hypothetical protein
MKLAARLVERDGWFVWESSEREWRDENTGDWTRYLAGFRDRAAAEWYGRRNGWLQ